MSRLLHIFVYGRERTDDEFVGILNDLDGRIGGDEVCVVRFSDGYYKRFREVEYSWRRFARPIYYQSVFSEFERQIETRVISHNGPCAIYLSEEGIWAVILKRIRDRHLEKVITISVQHGVAMLRNTPSEQRLDRVARVGINRISNFLFSYPGFGMGMGCGGFDINLVYGKSEKEHFERLGNVLVFSAPGLIKYDLISKVLAFRSDENMFAGSSALIALPACSPGGDIRGTLGQFIDVLVPLIERLVDYHRMKVIIRFHPGLPQEDCRYLLNSKSINNKVTVDEEAEIARSLVCCKAVFAAHSTALFEAGVVGIVPVAVRSECFDLPLPFPNEVVDLRTSFYGDLESVLSSETVEKYRSRAVAEKFDWLEILQPLVSILLPRN